MALTSTHTSLRKLRPHFSISLRPDGQELQWKVEELLAKSEKKVVMDFTDLKYLDSTGLGIVVFCAGKLNESGGELRVAGASPTILNLFKITRVDKVLHLDDTVEKAVGGFGKSED